MDEPTPGDPDPSVPPPDVDADELLTVVLPRSAWVVVLHGLTAASWDAFDYDPARGLPDVRAAVNDALDTHTANAGMPGSFAARTVATRQAFRGMAAAVNGTAPWPKEHGHIETPIGVEHKDEIKARVFARDGRCLLQGRAWWGDCFGPLTYHHLLKASAGGTWSLHNGVTLCAHHNDAVEDQPNKAWAVGLVIRNGELASQAWTKMNRWGLVTYGPDGSTG